MSSWTDLLQVLAAKRPEVTLLPPNVKHEDLWDLQHRVEALEAEVQDLRSILVAVLNRLHANEE